MKTNANVLIFHIFIYSINTLVKISKSAGAMLKPHAPKLIPALLESLSVLEPQVLNYLSLRATEQEKVRAPLSKKVSHLLKALAILD